MLELFSKKGNATKRVFTTNKFEFCAIMKGSTKSNRVIRAIIKSIAEQVSTLIHKCPYTGFQEFPNFTLPRTLLSIIPEGQYQIKIDINITETAKTNMRVMFEIETSSKF